MTESLTTPKQVLWLRGRYSTTPAFEKKPDAPFVYRADYRVVDGRIKQKGDVQSQGELNASFFLEQAGRELAARKLDRNAPLTVGKAIDAFVLDADMSQERYGIKANDLLQDVIPAVRMLLEAGYPGYTIDVPSPSGIGGYAYSARFERNPDGSVKKDQYGQSVVTWDLLIARSVVP